MTAIVHTISNDEVGTTVCGRLCDEPARGPDGAWSDEPVSVVNGNDVAVWDDVEFPSGATLCQDCGGGS